MCYLLHHNAQNKQCKSKKPSASVPPSMWETKFHTHINNRQNYSLAYMLFIFLDRKLEDKRFCKHSLTSICSYFFHERNSDSLGLSQIFELLHPFKGFITYIYTVILSYTLVSRHDLVFSAFTSRSISLLMTINLLCFSWQYMASTQFSNIISIH
jgi:hypothetical protein